MFFDEDDKLFGGTPKSKFFDIVYNANRNLVENEIEALIEELCTYEMLIEKHLGEDFDIKRAIDEFKYGNPSEFESRMIDRYIGSVGNILSNNE